MWYGRRRGQKLSDNGHREDPNGGNRQETPEAIVQIGGFTREFREAQCTLSMAARSRGLGDARHTEDL